MREKLRYEWTRAKLFVYFSWRQLDLFLRRHLSSSFVKTGSPRLSPWRGSWEKYPGLHIRWGVRCILQKRSHCLRLRSCYHDLDDQEPTQLIRRPGRLTGSPDWEVFHHETLSWRVLAVKQLLATQTDLLKQKRWTLSNLRWTFSCWANRLQL